MHFFKWLFCLLCAGVASWLQGPPVSKANRKPADGDCPEEPGQDRKSDDIFPYTPFFPY